MGEIYQKMKIVKRAPTLTSSKFNPKLAARRLEEQKDLVQKMKLCFKKQIRIVFIDETGFSMRPLSRKEFTRPGHQVLLERSDVNQKNVTVSAAIDESGLVHYEMIEGGQNVTSYITFLINLKNKLMRNEKIGLFFDGLWAHKNAQVIKMIKEWGWIPILNEAYQCEQNPIEQFFSIVKRFYYAERNHNQANPDWNAKGELMNAIMIKEYALYSFAEHEK